MNSKYAKFLSKTAKRRKESAIRKLVPLASKEGMITLAGGLPNPKTFPITDFSMKIKLPNGDSFEEKQLDFSMSQVERALQYSATPGVPDLLQHLKNIQSLVHSPPYEQYDCIVTNGSQAGLYKAFSSLLNEGDSILIEAPTYSGSLSALQPMNLNMIPIPIDENGIIPEKLEVILSNLKTPPKLLYTIPTGQNPSGATLSEARKRAIYELAMTYDFLILEDDPYYYLNFAEKESYPRSFLSIDHDERVIRFDSFSKVVSSGLRMGFATGPKDLIFQLNLHQQSSDLHASGLSQMCLAILLDEWSENNYAGLFAHMEHVQSFYRERCLAFESIVKEQLGDLVSFHTPKAGMFFWMKINGIDDTKSLIEEKALSRKVLLVPGQAFDPLDEPSPYVRASFSTASDEVMKEGTKRLASLIKESL